MEEQKKQEIIVTGQVQQEHNVQPSAQPAEKKRWKLSGLGWKKWVIIAAIVLAGCFALSLVFRVNLPRAQQIAQQVVGGQAQIVAQEIDSEFLFFYEYSFELSAADGSDWEVELDAFGNVTSIEQEGWHR